MWRALGQRWRWIAGVVVILGAGAYAATALMSAPEPVEDLERASEAGERAQNTSAEIVENLEAIVENLEAGAGFSEKSEEIQGLTKRQGQSLRDLADILESQLESLEKTQRSLRGTRTAIAGVARMGARQQQLLERALSALERIGTFAERASKQSSDFAWRALYGARLAEDSRDSFSGP